MWKVLFPNFLSLILILLIVYYSQLERGHTMAESITELQNIWSAVNKKLREDVEDVRFFDVFLSESYIYSFDKNEMIVAVNSKLAATILTTKYIGTIQESVKAVTGTSPKIKFDVSENLKTKTPVEDKPVYFKNSIVNPNLTFDNFVTGASNLEAKQAAMFIASNPGTGYNPLFIYSNPGLGKTHLLQAIVNFIREKMPGKKVLYCEAGDFFQEFIDVASGSKQYDSLKKYLTSVDVLLIDDIQQLSSKEKTLSFFFDIFNRNLMSGKQIVITSDKAPAELKGFEERLKSRFASGLTVVISQPEIPTCVAILRSKIESSPLDLNLFDPKVLDFIGEKFSRNVREIDSAFNKLVFYVTAYKPTKYIDMNIAMEALQSLLNVQDEKKKLSEQKIISVVAEYYHKTPSQLTGPSREGEITMARHVAMYLIRAKLDVPFTKIGYIFGGKDHSTVMSGVNKVEKSLKTNELLRTAVSEIETRLKS